MRKRTSEGGDPLPLNTTATQHTNRPTGGHASSSQRFNAAPTKVNPPACPQTEHRVGGGVTPTLTTRANCKKQSNRPAGGHASES